MLAAAAASYFTAAQPEAVPEVFDPRLPARDSGRDLPRSDARTQVPPGFERRNFGPFPDDEEQSAAATGGWRAPDQSPHGAVHPGGTGRTEEARGSDNVPSALLGVLPAAGSHPMPATFAPPEPAPWTDSGWVDFPRDVEPESAFAGVGVGTAPAAAGARAPLPRRVPRIPDVDFPLFESDPGEPAPDPVTQRQKLNRIADFLRDDETYSAEFRPDGVDLEAVLGAVRQVPQVRDAQLRWNAQAGHTLRIEFADGVDEGEVTRSVVRLLRAKLGLATQPSAEEPTVDSPFRGRVPMGAGRLARAGTQSGRSLPRPSGVDVPRLVVDNVTVTRTGAEATVEVRLRRPGTGLTAVGEGRGPGVDAYLSRLAATAAAHAVDQTLTAAGASRGKVFVEHVSVVPFGAVEVAVAVLVLTFDGAAEQVSGSAIVGDDPHVAVVRATLAALNRRLESLLS
jgi:hypothetical protein